MKRKTLEQFISQVDENITEDRAATKTLLMAIMKYMTTLIDSLNILLNNLVELKKF